MKKKNKALKPGGILLIILLSAAAGMIFTRCSSLKPVEPKLDPESEDFYRQTRFLFTKHERRIFDQLDSAETRKEFIRYFWEVRDPDPSNEENEFRDEIDRRFEYVSRYLRETSIPGWKTDRGRIYMVLGPPTQVDRNVYTSNPEYQGRIIHWYYGYMGGGDSGYAYAGSGGIFFRFVDQYGHGIYRLDLRSVPLRALDVMEEMKYNYIVAEGDKAFDWLLPDFDLKYDGDVARVHIFIDPKYVTFEEADSRMSASFNIDFIVYGGENMKRFNKYSRAKTISLQKEALLKQDAPLEIVVPLELEEDPAKVLLDVVVTDVFGNKKKRKVYTINIKK